MASENDIIRDICALDSYYVASKDITWETTNQLFNEVGEYYYKYADGLKTGHTDDALYCLAATAKRGDVRLIAIVLGEEDSKIRNSETIELLDYGFNNVKLRKLKDKEDVIGAFEAKITSELSGKSKATPVSTVKEEVLEALVALGYSASNAARALDKMTITESTTTEQLLSDTLKQMSFL